jgi:hypothetical protein
VSQSLSNRFPRSFRQGAPLRKAAHWKRGDGALNSQRRVSKIAGKAARLHTSRCLPASDVAGQGNLTICYRWVPRPEFDLAHINGLWVKWRPVGDPQGIWTTSLLTTKFSLKTETRLPPASFGFKHIARRFHEPADDPYFRRMTASAPAVNRLRT